MSMLNQDKSEKLDLNIRFCEKPLPWSKGAKDHRAFKYIHYFFLKRIGNRRYEFITEEDALEFNSYMRCQKWILSGRYRCLYCYCDNRKNQRNNQFYPNKQTRTSWNKWIIGICDFFIKKRKRKKQNYVRENWD